MSSERIRIKIQELDTDYADIRIIVATKVNAKKKICEILTNVTTCALLKKRATHIVLNARPAATGRSTRGKCGGHARPDREAEAAGWRVSAKWQAAK
jgi:hypothetical protein